MITKVLIKVNPDKITEFDMEEGFLEVTLEDGEWKAGEIQSFHLNPDHTQTLKSWKSIYIGDRGGIDVV